jgi:hypothetical protein
MHTTRTHTRQLRARAAQHSWGGGVGTCEQGCVGVGAPLLRLRTCGRIIRQPDYDSCSGCACRMWAAVLVAVLEVNSQRLQEHTWAHREAVESRATIPQHWVLVNPGRWGGAKLLSDKKRQRTTTCCVSHTCSCTSACTRVGWETFS